MSAEYALGIVIGVLCGLALVAVIFFLSKKLRGGKGKTISCDFDEKQTIERGKAFKYAFIIMAAYFTAAGIFKFQWSSPLIVNATGIFASLMVFVVTCIMKDAYFTVSENPKRVLAVVIGALVLNLVCIGFYIGRRSDFVESGIYDTIAINILCVVLLFVVLLALGLKKAIDKRPGQ